MKTYMQTFAAAVAVLQLSASFVTAQSIVFSDNFETPSLDPFWFGFANQGSITFPSTAQAHSGSQSVQFNSPANVFNAVGMQHSFATPVYGQVSVWVFDTGADLPQSHALDLSIGNSGLTVATLFTLKFDNGSSPSGTYDYSLGSAGINPTTIDRSQAWHQFAIASTPGSLTLAVDGATVYSSTAAQPFDSVIFRMNGGPISSPWISYWDDFALSVTPVPEPSTLALLALGTVVVVGSRALRKRDGKVGRFICRLTMRCSEPGHRATVPINASRGPGR